MEWLGQYIQAYKARFRNDVYLEDLTTTTETDMIVVGADGLLSKRAIDAITVDVSDFMTNGLGNRVLTASGADSINANAALTFDGAMLNLLSGQTTGDALNIYANLLTSGTAVTINADDALTASATKSLMFIDYDKSGVTADGQTSNTSGLTIHMTDAATNHANSTVVNTGVSVVADAASDQGTIHQIGYFAQLLDGDVASTIGFSSRVENGGTDFQAVSSADSADKFTIQTGASGATTLKTTHNGVGVDADFTVEADGDIILSAADNSKTLISGSLAMGTGVATINNIGVIQVAAQTVIDHDQLANFASNEHYTQNQITTVGIIGTGQWRGTAINATYLDGQSGTNTGDETLASINALDITEVGTIDSGVWQGTAIATAYIADDAITEDKLANTLLAEIDANTAKATNVTTNLTATTHASQITINSSDGTNVIVAEASGSIAGVMSVTHHDKLDAIEASATADQTKADIDGLAITTVGTIDTGSWRGDAIASAYLDADTAHLGVTQTFTGAKTFNADIVGQTTKERWVRNVAYVVNAGTTEYFIPMVGASENTNNANATSQLLMPVGGRLLKAHIKANINLHSSSNQVTVKMINWDVDEVHNTSNDSIMCAVTQTGPTNAQVGVFDFTGTLDSGIGAESAVFTAGEIVAIGVKHSQAIGNAKMWVTLVFEMDWAGY